MFYALHEAVQMATEELSSFHGKKKNAVDAENLLPYLVLVTVTAFHDLY